jgi:hypothetical protein
MGRWTKDQADVPCGPNYHCVRISTGTLQIAKLKQKQKQKTKRRTIASSARHRMPREQGPPEGSTATRSTTGLLQQRASFQPCCWKQQRTCRCGSNLDTLHRRHSHQEPQCSCKMFPCGAPAVHTPKAGLHPLARHATPHPPQRSHPCRPKFLWRRCAVRFACRVPNSCTRLGCDPTKTGRWPVVVVQPRNQSTPE